MRRRALGLALLLSLLALPAAARRLPFKPGESHTFSSPSKRWSVQIIYVKNPNTGPCKAVLRDGRKVVWRRDWPATPGSVTVPDDGAAFCALDFLNYDEHWYRAVSFYGKDGALLRQVPYVSPAEPQNATTTRWLRGWPISAWC